MTCRRLLLCCFAIACGQSAEPAFLREANDITRAALRQIPDWATRR